MHNLQNTKCQNNAHNLLPDAHVHKNKCVSKHTQYIIPAFVDLYANIDCKSEAIAAKNLGFFAAATPTTADFCAPLYANTRQDFAIDLHAIAPMTKQFLGKQLANMHDYDKHHIRIISHLHHNFDDLDVLLQALYYAKDLDLTVFFYPNQKSLAKYGVVHDSYQASRQGLIGIPDICETVALSTQLLLVEHTGIRAHFGSISSESGIQMIRQYKDKGLNITCDVAMHQLFLDERATDHYNTLAYVLPPLRTHKDKLALQKALQDGTIDAICSQHTPVLDEDKNAPFAQSTAGISAIDSFLPKALELVQNNVLSLAQMVEKISTNPARILGVDVTSALLIDTDVRHCLQDNMQSWGKNTPFLHDVLSGQIIQRFD